MAELILVRKIQILPGGWGVVLDDLIANGSMAAAKEKGLVRSEGKEYVMKDGDVVLFRFNV